jgi:hypothetical protein
MQFKTVRAFNQILLFNNTSITDGMVNAGSVPHLPHAACPSAAFCLGVFCRLHASSRESRLRHDNLQCLHLLSSLSSIPLSRSFVSFVCECPKLQRPLSSPQTAIAVDADAVNLPGNPEVSDVISAEVDAASAEYDSERAYLNANANAVTG